MNDSTPLSLMIRLGDGSIVYLQDGLDIEEPLATTNPFDARSFPDRAALDAYLAVHPEMNHPEIEVVPWPVDLDIAWRPTPVDQSATLKKSRPAQGRSGSDENDCPLFTPE